MSDGIELSQYINNLRRELEKSLTASKGAQIVFKPNTIELELSVTAELVKDGKGKVSFKVFSVGVEGGGGASKKDVTVQTLKLSLDPVGPDGKTQLLIADGTRKSF